MELEIFILTYNRQSTLINSIQSILCQTYSKFNLIILDNNSNYDVQGLVNSFNDDRISVIKNESNIGPVENYAKAIKLASKDLVMVFHDDDTLPENFIECQLLLFSKFKDAGFIVSGINLTTAENSEYNEDDTLKYIYFSERGQMLKCFYDFPTFGASSIMFKTEVAKKGIYGYEYFGNVVDRMILLNCSSQYPFVYMINPKYNALQHADQDSSNRNWSFEYDISLANLFLKNLEDFKLFSYSFKVVKSISEFYVYSRKRISLFETLNKINFRSRSYMFYFILLIPRLYIKSIVIKIIKKYFLNFFIKLNHRKYENKLLKSDQNIVME